MTSASRNGHDANGAGTVPWAQQAATQRDHKTDRRRQMVQGLPSWDPLPPGEIYVQRHQRG